MSDVLDGIRSAVGERNLSQSLSRDECGVDDTGLPALRIIVDADLAFPAHQREGSRCDFVVFYPAADERHVVTVPLELKSGRAEVSHVSMQLQGGADFAARFAPANTICYPVLIRGKRINLEKLNRAKVQFRGRRMTIGTARCNRPGNLERALASTVTGD